MSVVKRTPTRSYFTTPLSGLPNPWDLDGLTTCTFKEKLRITVPNGPGMTIFSPDGKCGYVCSSFSPETVVVSTTRHQIVGRVKQESPFCPDISATPDGKQVWFTLKDVGKTTVFSGKPPFNVLKVLDTGPITNHVNIVRNERGQFAYVSVGGLNVVKVFRTDDFTEVTEIPTGDLPHGLWPSGVSSQASIRTRSSPASATMCLKRRRKRFRTRLSRWPAIR